MDFNNVNIYVSINKNREVYLKKNNKNLSTISKM